MKINAAKIRLALHSPRRLAWGIRHVLRRAALRPLGPLLPNGYSFAPEIITINITGRCNLRCSMCMQPRADEVDGFSATVSPTRHELSAKEWKGVVDQAAPWKPVFYFSGGEPLLYGGLMEVLEHIKRQHLPASLVTNGTALEHFAESIVSIGVDNITVSLDGPQEVHDRLRGLPGTYDRALRGIRAIETIKKKRGASFPILKVNCVITPETFASIPRLITLLEQESVEEFSLQHAIFDTAENVALHNRLFSEALGSKMSKEAGEFYEAGWSVRLFNELESTLNRVASSRGRVPVRFFPEVSPRDWRHYYLDLGHPFPRKCAAPWSTMRLLADGTFEPCLHYRVGNVLMDRLRDLWNNSAMRQFRQAIIRQRLFPACARCCYRCFR